MGKGVWIAAQYRFGGDKQLLSVPIFGELVTMLSGEKRFYAGGGPSYFLPDETFVILSTYPLGKVEGDGDEILEAEVRFARDYPILPMDIAPRMDWNPSKGIITENIEGWLAPNGAYYGHGLGLHVSTAHHLALQLYGNSDGADHLRDIGWLSIHDGGYIRNGLPVTDQQSAGLIKMANGVQDDRVRRHLMRVADRSQ